MPRGMDREQRRAELAEAVWRVIRERGIGAVSVRTVAEEAGVVVGSLRHVFPDRAGLLLYSAELMVERARARILALPRTDDPVANIGTVLRELLPLSPESRAELEVNVALIAETPALPRLAGVRDRAHAELLDVCRLVVGVLQGGARPDQTATAQRLHALVDGLAVHLLLRPPGEDPSWATDLLDEEVRRIAAAPGPSPSPPPSA